MHEMREQKYRETLHLGWNVNTRPQHSGKDWAAKQKTLIYFNTLASCTLCILPSFLWTTSLNEKFRVDSKSSNSNEQKSQSSWKPLAHGFNKQYDLLLLWYGENGSIEPNLLMN